MKKKKQTLLVLAITLFFWFVPASWLGLDAMTVLQQRTLAVFIFAALMWIFEIIPAWATSVCTMAVLLFTVSDEAILLTPLTGGGFAEGTAVPHPDLMASFGNPIIILFLGGFILANCATKVGFDSDLARGMLKLLGTRPALVLLGFLLLNGLLSMFMSNTATAAMMFTFMIPVLSRMPQNERGRIGLTLSIPIAANLGGLGTPIGTPPNAIAIGQLSQLGIEVGFSTWMLHMVPYVLVMLLLAWGLLLLLYPFKTKSIEIDFGEKKPHDRSYWIVVITLLFTIALWVTEEWTGIDSNVVAMVPFAVFAVTGIFAKEDFLQIDWAVLWMVAGGFALGTAFHHTGLGDMFINAIPFKSWSVWLVFLMSGFVIYAISTFISNTSAANLLMPILALVGSAMGDNLAVLGGVTSMLLFVAVNTSLPMTLPISTPPNAIASSTGFVPTRDMLIVGLIIGITGFVLAFGWILLFPL